MAEAERKFEEPFVPSVRAKHRAPNNLKKGRQGREDDEVIIVEEDRALSKKGKQRLIKDDVVNLVHDVVRQNPKRKGRGFNPRYNRTPPPQPPRPDAQIGNDPNMVPDDIEKKFLVANRVYYVVLKPRLRVSKCQGCDGTITEQDRKFPKDMVFLYKMRRKVPPPGGQGEWILSSDKRNCYFHSDDLGCLRQIYELRNIENEDLYMSNANFKLLKKENIEELQRRDHWDGIISNRQKLRIEGHL